MSTADSALTGLPSILVSVDASSGSYERAETLRRRSFLGVAAGTGVALALRGRSSRVLTAGQSAMVLQVARAGAVFPIDFPSFGEQGPAWRRATPSRLRAAARRASRRRLGRAIDGADALIGHGLLHKSRARLLDGIGEVACDPASDLTAVVALAIATVSRHFDPNSDDAAELWIDILRGLAQSGWRAGKAI